LKVAKSLASLSIKAGFKKKTIDEAVTNLLYDGIERNFLSKKNINDLLRKLENSDTEQSKDYIRYFKNVQKKISLKQSLDLEQEDSNIKFLLKADINKKTKKFLLNLGDLSENDQILAKISDSDLIVISKQAHKLSSEINSQADKILFLDLYKLIDHHQDDEKLSLLNSLDKIYRIAKDNNNLATIENHSHIKEIKNILKSLDSLNQKSLNFYSRRKKHLKIQDTHSASFKKAKRDYSRYREQLLICKARTVHPDKIDNALKWKSMTYLIAIGSVVWGYNKTNGWDKEKGWEKFTLEIGINMLGTAVSNKNVLADGTSTGEKIIIKYALSFLINLLEKTIYKARFEKDLITELEDTDFFKAFVKQLTKNKELSSIFKRIEQSKDRQAEIQEILTQYNFQEDKTVINSAQSDAFFEMISVAHKYENLHHDNFIIKTGEESKDRFYYNNTYGVFSAIKSILIGLFTYNLTCQSKAIGPYLVAGNNSKNVAIFIGTLIFILDKYISTEIYYGTRQKLIKQ